MSGIRKLSQVFNTAALKEFGMDGLMVQVEKYGKRHICSCGKVFKTDDENAICPVCNNEKFGTLPSTRYYVPEIALSSRRVQVATDPTIYSAENDPLCPDNELRARHLMLVLDHSASSFEFTIDFETLVKYDAMIPQFRFPAYGNVDLILEHGHKIVPASDKGIFEAAKTWVQAHSAFKNIQDLNLTLRKLDYERNWVLNLSDEEFEKYGPRIIRNMPAFMATVEKVLRDGRTISVTGIDEFLKAIEVPRFIFENMTEGQRFQRLSFDEHKISYSLEKATMYAVRFGKFDMSKAVSILSKMASESEYEQNRFADFLIKNASDLGGYVLDRYLQIKELFKDEEPVDSKEAAIRATKNWMETKKVDSSRIEAFFAVLDKNPMAAIELLKERKTLSDAENELVKRNS